MNRYSIRIRIRYDIRFVFVFEHIQIRICIRLKITNTNTIRFVFDPFSPIATGDQLAVPTVKIDAADEATGTIYYLGWPVCLETPNLR